MIFIDSDLARTHRPAFRCGPASAQGWPRAALWVVLGFALLEPVTALAQGTSLAGPTRILEDRPDERFTFEPAYTYGHLTDGLPDRNGLELAFRWRVDPKLSLGARIDAQRRPPDTDVSYGASFSWTPVEDFEWHGAAAFVPDADFWAQQTYATGVEWRTGKLFSLLFDYQRENYSEGNVLEYTPGLTYWLDERSWVTGRYTFGRAYAVQDFHSYSVALSLGMPNDGRLSFRFTHGGDPDKEAGAPVTVTNSTIYEALWRLPLRKALFLVLGAELEDRKDSYTRVTGSLGLDVRF